MKRSNKIFAFLLIFILIVISLFWGYNYIQRLFHPLKYASTIEKYAAEDKIDASLVFAVIKCESSYNPKAVSNIGAMGLMQITPETFTWSQTKLSPNMKLSEASLFDPETNIKFGTLILSLHLKEFGDKTLAIAAYHAGRGKVNEWLRNRGYSADGKTLTKIPTSDTASYVKRVLEAQKTYTNLYKEEFKNE